MISLFFAPWLAVSRLFCLQHLFILSGSESLLLLLPSALVTPVCIECSTLANGAICYLGLSGSSLVVDVLLLLFKKSRLLFPTVHHCYDVSSSKQNLLFLAATRNLKGWPGKSAGAPPYPRRVCLGSSQRPAVPILFGTKDWFPGRQFFQGLGVVVWRLIQAPNIVLMICICSHCLALASPPHIIRDYSLIRSAPPRSLTSCVVHSGGSHY